MKNGHWTFSLVEKLDFYVYFLDEILLFGWTRLDFYRHSEAQKNYILWDILPSKKLHNIYFLYVKGLATQIFKAKMILDDGFLKTMGILFKSKETNLVQWLSDFDVLTSPIDRIIASSEKE